MNVLITFQPNIKYDNFEGSRLRKTIKGALEMVDLPYVSSTMQNYDIIHLLSPSDESKENDAIDKGIPVVVSALYTENDPNASYFDFKYKDGEIVNTLTPKALRFLNKANLILVPTESSINLLRAQGVESKMMVMSPGVSLSRFDFSRDDEKDLFFRYFREDRNKQLVVGNGDYSYVEGLSAFANAAKACPEAIFYFFGQNKAFIKSRALRKILKNAPGNCKFCDIVPDDIYRSALLNAQVFMISSYKYGGVVSLLEAMAAKCQIIVREQSIYDGFIKDGETGYVAKFSETLISLTKDCLDGKLRLTVADAYQSLENQTLEEIGKKLKEIYQDEINAYIRLGGSKR